MCYREHAYTSVHKSCFSPSWFSGNHCPIFMFVGVGGHDVGWVMEDQCHVNKSWHASCRVLTSLPSINGWSKGQNSLNLFISVPTMGVMHPDKCVFVWVNVYFTPTAPSSPSSSFREAVSMASALFAPPRWGGMRTTDRTLVGDGSSN